MKKSQKRNHAHLARMYREKSAGFFDVMAFYSIIMLACDTKWYGLMRHWRNMVQSLLGISDTSPTTLPLNVLLKGRENGRASTIKTKIVDHNKNLSPRPNEDLRLMGFLVSLICVLRWLKQWLHFLKHMERILLNFARSSLVFDNNFE